MHTSTGCIGVRVQRRLKSQVPAGGYGVTSRSQLERDQVELISTSLKSVYRVLAEHESCLKETQYRLEYQIIQGWSTIITISIPSVCGSSRFALPTVTQGSSLTLSALRSRDRTSSKGEKKKKHICVRRTRRLYLTVWHGRTASSQLSRTTAASAVITLPTSISFYTRKSTQVLVPGLSPVFKH
jgi:hypothetical protein